MMQWHPDKFVSDRYSDGVRSQAQEMSKKANQMHDLLKAYLCCS